MTRYELLDRIGVGGMAEIFRGKAVAAGGFEKPVAIKRILPHLSQDKRFVELLIAEAKVLSLLKHRNIVQIFDVGLGDDGQYFLVMEYVDGKDLGAVQRAFEARRRRMPFDLALHIGAEICEALEHAHTARAPDGKPMNLVHRDVSPSNVLLSRAGESKLTDFGIAKRAEQEATGHGAVRGKFAYISPEQARNEHIDPRSDVFSVAILMWEMVTSRRLFSGLGDLEALRAVREVQVPRPLEIDPRLPPEIDQLLMAALDRDLRKRPTAGELGGKLRSMRYGLDVTVGDPATELAKIIETADEVQRESQQMVAMSIPPRSAAGMSVSGMSQVPRTSGSFDSFDHTEATVIRIRTADGFGTLDGDGGISRAREVIDRFDEEETRQAHLSGDQLRILRSGGGGKGAGPARLPGVASGGSRGGASPPRPRRSTEDPTTARPPLSPSEVQTLDGEPAEPPPSLRFDSDESTHLLARSRDHRTPMPLPQRRPATAPPPLPGGPPAPAVMGDPDPMPGTVHSRNPQRPRVATPGPVPRGPAMPLGAPPQTPLPAGPPPMLPPPLVPGAQTIPGGSSMPKPMPMPGGPPMLPQPMPMPGGPPMMPQPMPMPQPPGMPMPPPPQPMPGGYAGWGGPPPGAAPGPPNMFDQRPGYPPRPSMPNGPGFQRSRRPALKPWMLVVGALVMAAVAFAVTRAFLS